MAKLMQLLAKYARITLVCHPNADPDCLGAAYAIKVSLSATYPKKSVAILAPDGINAASVRLNDYLAQHPLSDLPPGTDLYLLVDTSSLDQVPAVKSSIKKDRIPYAMVDHHVADQETVDGAVFTIIEQKSSTCEVLFNILEKKTLDRKALQALLSGLIYDSRRFLIQPQSSIVAAAHMIALGGDAAQAVGILTAEEDPSEKMAKLKGVARLKLYQADQWLIAITRVGSFESSVARSLTNLGADLALVVSRNDKKVRLSGRSTEKFFRESGFNLAKDMMQFLANSFEGQGGGHPTAASVNLKGLPDAIESAALKLVALKIGLNHKDIQEINTKK